MSDKTADGDGLTAFGQPALGAEIYELFDAKRMRVVRRGATSVFKRLMTAEEAVWGEQSFCAIALPALVLATGRYSAEVCHQEMNYGN